MKQTDKNIKEIRIYHSLWKNILLTFVVSLLLQVDISYSMMLIPHGQQKYLAV